MELSGSDNGSTEVNFVRLTPARPIDTSARQHAAVEAHRTCIRRMPLALLFLVILFPAA